MSNIKSFDEFKLKRQSKNNESSVPTPMTISEILSTLEQLKEEGKELVHSDPTAAMLIGRIIMEHNPEVLYVNVEQCLSRKGMFFRLKQVMKSDVNQPVYATEQLLSGILEYSLDKGWVSIE